MRGLGVLPLQAGSCKLTKMKQTTFLLDFSDLQYSLSSASTPPTQKYISFQKEFDEGDRDEKITSCEGGAWESLDNGETEEGGTWTVKNGTIHAVDDDGDAFIFELNSDGNLAVIAVENGGNKKHLPKEEQLTFKRIK